MSVELSARAPRLRCQACGSQQVEAVCHHCGRPLCARHVERYAGRHLPFFGRAGTHEMAGLGLDRPDGGRGDDKGHDERSRALEPAHCVDCLHVVRPVPWVWMALGTFIAASGLLLLARGGHPWLGRGALGSGTFLAGAAAVVHERRLHQRRATRPPMPTLPKVDSVVVTEQLRCSQSVDPQGHIHAACEPLDVRCDVVVRFLDADRRRLALYRRRFGLAEHQPIAIHAGFLALHGAVGLRAVDGQDGWAQAQVLALREDARRIECFASRAARVDDHGRWSWRYGVLGAIEPRRPPVQLVPWFGGDSGGRELCLQVQWEGAEMCEPPQGRGAALELVELEIPVDWGDIESGPPRMLVGEAQESATSGQRVRHVQWRHWDLTEAQRNAGSSRFWVRFRRAIERERILRGRVVMAFDRGLSGITGARWHLPTGWRSGCSFGGSARQPALVELRVTTRFDFSLAALSYERSETSSETNGEGVERFDGVAPDGPTIMRLTKALADAQYPFSRKLEERSRFGEGGEILRAWDLTGRVYREGVVPIDWHLVVSGQQCATAARPGQRSFTRTDLTLSGSVSTPEMTEQLKACRSGLSSVIRSALTTVDSREPEAVVSERHHEAADA